jgi:hypothetical protein
LIPFAFLILSNARSNDGELLEDEFSTAALIENYRRKAAVFQA